MARFLVVDDDPLSVKALSGLLEGDGHDVAPFTGGAHAVEALARESFDAVVTDLEMPHVDGHAVVRAAREHHPHACVVVVSARAHESWPALVEAGACVIADKPLEYDEVAKALADCRAHGGPGAHGRCHMRARPHGHQVIPVRRK
jgi:DNA-binding NtrC family response regulator